MLVEIAKLGSGAACPPHHATCAPRAGSLLLQVPATRTPVWTVKRASGVLQAHRLVLDVWVDDLVQNRGWHHLLSAFIVSLGRGAVPDKLRVICAQRVVGVLEDFLHAIFAEWESSVMSGELQKM